MGQSIALVLERNVLAQASVKRVRLGNHALVRSRGQASPQLDEDDKEFLPVLLDIAEYLQCISGYCPSRLTRELFTLLFYLNVPEYPCYRIATLR